MVKGSPKNNKWMRRYRSFFVIGIVILCCQVYLALKFFSLNKNVESQEVKWEQWNFENDVDQEVESNSAGKIKPEAVDDEEAVVSSKSKKSRVNQTYTLRYDELNFTPACKISTKDAVSAINRAKTQYCKQLISNITCLSNDGNLYPKELKGTCPSKGLSTGKQLGCFKDEKNYRLLSGYFGTNKKSNSPHYCIKLCLQSGFPYAGVEYSNECFCGTEEPPLSSKIPDSSCNSKCPGDPHSTCGGYYAINIFQTGISKFVAQIASTEGNNVTVKPVKIVFLLTLNGRAVRQVKRLLKLLYNKNHYYYIHVDVRQDYLYRELLPLEKTLPNVRLTRKRFATIWGGASLLEMLRSCMWELLNREDWTWDFVLNLSESDLPVKTVGQLTEFLALNRDRNFVKSHGREVQRFIQKQGLDKTFVECETRMWRIGDRVLPFGIQVDGGSDWIALSRKFVEYVSNPQSDDLISGLLKIFKHTLLPAESFFHTALRNSKFCDTYVDNNLHVTNWKRKLGCKCQYKHVVDWCGCSPNDFRLDDWPRILNTFTRQLYFARKFEPIINQAIVLKLELWLHDMEEPSKEVRNLYGYWQSLYHHNDLGVVADDGLFTLSDSIKRHLATRNATCDLGLGKLLEVHSYHHNDSYKYTLFKFADRNKNSVEVAVGPVAKISLNKSSIVVGHVETLTVSSEYDQKEQVSRNFLRLLSPYSEPVLVYSFNMQHSTKGYNVTSLWIGPSGLLYDSVEFFVDESTQFGHARPVLKQPVLPGVWKVKLIYKNNLLATVRFPVVPLEYYLGLPIKDHQAAVVNVGTKPSKDFKGSFQKFLPTDAERRRLEKLSNENVAKRGEALAKWVDSLFAEFFRTEKACAKSRELTDACSVKLDVCVGTDWSSLSPDPKSALGVLNQSTGTFDIW
nr:unnamed protein product [Callosobruchus chinensis]